MRHGPRSIPHAGPSGSLAARAGALRGTPVSRLALGALAVLAVVRLATLLADVLLLLLLAIVLATALDMPIRWLSRWMRRSLATALTLLVLLLAGAGLTWLAVPRLVAQASDLGPALATAAERARGYAEAIPSSWLTTLERRAGQLLPQLVPLAVDVASLLATGLVLLLLAVFLVAKPRVYVNGLVRLVPRRHEDVARELLGRLGVTLRGWTRGTIVAMAVIGAVTALGLWLLDVNAWLVLAGIAFVGEAIPYVGPVASAIPAIAVALATSPTLALYVLLFYLGVQQLEGNLLQPLIMRRAVKVRPAVLLVGQLCMAVLFGGLGLLVATPFIAVVQVAVEHLYVERLLGKRGAR